MGQAVSKQGVSVMESCMDCTADTQMAQEENAMTKQEKTTQEQESQATKLVAELWRQLEANNHKNGQLEKYIEQLHEERRLLLEENVPRYLQDQTKDFLRGRCGELTLQGFDLTGKVAKFAVALLRLLQQKKEMHCYSQNAFATLALEREMEDPQGVEVIGDFLRQPAGLPDIVNSLKLTFWPLGQSPNARETCRAFLGARKNWRSVDLRYCNFVFDERHKTNMSYVTQGLAAQTALEEFTLYHGFDVGIPPMEDAELSEVVEILSTKKKTLRSLVIRDQYSSETQLQGEATTKALVNLLETSDRCKHKLDCQLEMLIWDIPCTEDLYAEGSDLQQQFLSAVLRNESLLWVQLRRVSIDDPLMQKVDACTSRNQNILKVRTLLKTRTPVGLWGYAVGALAFGGRSNIGGGEEDAVVHSSASAIYLALANTLPEHAEHALPAAPWKRALPCAEVPACCVE